MLYNPTCLHFRSASSAVAVNCAATFAKHSDGDASIRTKLHSDHFNTRKIEKADLRAS